VLIYPVAVHRPCGHVCAQVEPLPWQQTTLKTIRQQPLPPSTFNVHPPPLKASPTHYINTPSLLQAAACRVAMVSVLGHNNQQLDAQSTNGGGRHEATMMRHCHCLRSSSVPIQVSLHKCSPPFPCLTLDPGAISLSAMWQPNDDTTNVIVHRHQTDNAQPNKRRSKCSRPWPVLTSPVAILVFFGVGWDRLPFLGVEQQH